ncbi:thioredoxin domain-containing protein [Streptomyces sp. NPDC057011]|uniref:thioredoxin domain-containing protein n=1 Tax=unclassified Streptomyces TaxID=2593676 RepID=UPI00363CA877
MIRSRRRLVAVVAAGVLALATWGCAPQPVAPPAQEPSPVGPAYARVADVPQQLAADGTTILVGDPKASLTLHLYEDPRCPYCKEFEVVESGRSLRTMTLRREVKTEYTMASFLDDRIGGSGSKKAVNALRAALEAGKFAEYHAVLYENQPEESVDGYTDAFLLEMAARVSGLRSTEFDSAVTTMKYADFVTRSQQAYEKAGGPENPRGPGTPSAGINGSPVRPELSGVLYNRLAFEALIKEIRRNPQRWR